MREIKFRGKRVDTGEWVYGYFYNGVTTENPICVSDCRIQNVIIENGTMWNVIPETVGQYTGLKDKNGVDIYEGDLIYFTTYSYIEPLTDGKAEIVYDNTNACFKFKESHPKFCYRTMNELCENAYTYELEVIGNIHDNPELLEAK